MRAIKGMKREDLTLFVQFYQLLEELLFLERERLKLEQKNQKILEKLARIREVEIEK